jgi:hypothetical protein
LGLKTKCRAAEAPLTIADDGVSIATQIELDDRYHRSGAEIAQRRVLLPIAA